MGDITYMDKNFRPIEGVTETGQVYYGSTHPVFVARKEKEMADFIAYENSPEKIERDQRLAEIIMKTQSSGRTYTKSQRR